jgi:hypothetical protein
MQKSKKEKEEMMKLYMAVTADKYELPCAVTDTMEKLAVIYGLDKANISHYLKDSRVRKKYGVRFVKVEVQ